MSISNVSEVSRMFSCLHRYEKGITAMSTFLFHFIIEGFRRRRTIRRIKYSALSDYLKERPDTGQAPAVIADAAAPSSTAADHQPIQPGEDEAG